ncbi:MAG: carbohydrate kinase family protein [Christensenellales bacterium]|jgi:ribokinase
MKILCVGTVVCDITVKPVPKDIFELGTTRIELLQIMGGGDASNAASDLVVLGDEPRLIGVVGDDIFGRQLLEILKGRNVDTGHIRIQRGVNTSSTVVLIASDGERSFCYRPGSNEDLRESDVTNEDIAWCDHVHIASAMRLTSMDGEGVAKLFRRAHAAGKTTSMDLTVDHDDIWLPKIQEPLHHCDIFIPSDYEVSRVCGLTDPVEMKEFFRPYGLKVFGVKLGARGVYLTDFENDYRIPTLLEGTPVDTTGAGDAFCAAFVSAYKRGYSIEACGHIASAAACFVISEVGTVAGMKDFDTLKKLVEDSGRSLD